MRIAHVTATFPPYMAGTGNVCYHNALALARIGHQVTVYTADGRPAKEFDPPGVTVRRLPAVCRFGNAPLLPGLLRIRDADIIHLHYPFIFGAEMVSAVARIRRIPLVLTYHNDLIGEGLRRWLFAAYRRLTDGLVLGGAAKLGVLSEDHARSSLRASWFGRRRQDLVVVPNGVDAELFRPQPCDSALWSASGLPSESCTVLFVGALDRAHYFKGVPILLDAVSRIEGARVGLWIVGDGDRKVRYQDQAARLGIAGRTVFAGCIPFPEIVRYYACADLLVLPSIKLESFGIVIIEAMACGLPVVASDLPGVRTVVSDGRDGLLTPPGDARALADAIRFLAENPDQRKEMGNRGRAKVEARYAWPKILPHLIRLYEAALEGAGPVP
jgi:glycosyltransferase involved in cell wall biosynthesis